MKKEKEINPEGCSYVEYILKKNAPEEAEKPPIQNVSGLLLETDGTFASL